MKAALLETRSVETVGSAGEVSAFGMSDDPDDLAHLFWILRDALYTNKILAVLREYGANAWDAHREVDKDDLPIKVVLPTQLDTSLVIRDFGPGLSEEFMMTKFVKAGRSTKRESDKIVGMLGIGRLAGFAYNDSFTVTSYHGGMKKVYHAIIDETNIGYIRKIHEAALPEENLETGIEIKVPVNPHDIHNFHREASALFRYFRPLPKINLRLQDLDFEWQTQNGFLSRNRSFGRYADQWQAVMGCIPYRLDLNQIEEELKEEGLSEFASSMKGGLYFEIGDVLISANREDLQYKDRTKKAIVDKFKQVIQELQTEVKALAEEEGLSGWARREKFQAFVEATRMPLGKEYSFWNNPNVTLYKRGEQEEIVEEDGEKKVVKVETGPKHFTLKRLTDSYSSSGRRRKSLSEATSVRIDFRYTRFLLKDTVKSYAGYVRTDWDHVIDPRGESTPEEAMKEALAYLSEANLDGIEILKMSEMAYETKNETRNGQQDLATLAKYDQDTFMLSGMRDCAPYSKNWEIQSRTPDPDDVYVIINRFTPCQNKKLQNGDGFFRLLREDARLLKGLFDEELPEIWGLKSTQANPVTRETSVGIPYEEWRLKKFRELFEAHPDLSDDLEALSWADFDFAHFDTWKSPASFVKTSLSFLKEEGLDGRHRIVRFETEWLKAVERVSKLNEARRKNLRELTRIIGVPPKSQAHSRWANLVEKYPLLNKDPRVNQWGLGVFYFRETRNHYLNYVRLIDSQGA